MFQKLPKEAVQQGSREGCEPTRDVTRENTGVRAGLTAGLTERRFLRVAGAPVTVARHKVHLSTSSPILFLRGMKF